MFDVEGVMFVAAMTPEFCGQDEMVNGWNSYCIDQQEEIERWLVF